MAREKLRDLFFTINCIGLEVYIVMNKNWNKFEYDYHTVGHIRNMAFFFAFFELYIGIVGKNENRKNELKDQI